MAYELLSEPIRRYIREKKWEQLRPIQNAAIQHILSTDNHYILASGTASGKTEAAFLPILSKVDFNESGVQVLCISPLIALINDQFNRVEELCKNLEVPVTKWHGEASRGQKDKLIKNPEGIVLITPESIEAMFVNRPYNVKQLFANVKFVVIDEIHSFIGTDRGLQLKSLLARLQEINKNKFRVIGLSATLGDFDQAKKFTGEEQKTIVLRDNSKKEIKAVFRYFPGTGAELPLSLLKDLYKEVSNSKVLVFPNSRGRAEEIAVKLKKISEKVNGHPNYFSHHSSVHKDEREYVEYFAKNNKQSNFCIACTSTLELGIDIGNVDEVVQVDATHSIASLIQRVGRSGRREGATSSLFLYATNKWSVLQSIACWLLYKEGYIEPPAIVKKPYDIVLHQALSVVKERSGIRITDLISELKKNPTFDSITEDEIIEIITHLIATDILEKLQQEVIIGVEGEKVVNNMDFYGMFMTEETFKVSNAGNTIGGLPFSFQLQVDENILLAAKIWKITDVDFKAKKIEVIPAKDGKVPKFSGNGGITDPKIREKMLEILYSSTEYEFLDPTCKDVLDEMRKDFSVFKITDFTEERPLLVRQKNIELFTFAGTKINKALELLFSYANIEAYYLENKSSFVLDIEDEGVFSRLAAESDLQQKIENYIRENLPEDGLPNSKFGYLLPTNYKVRLVMDKVYDLEGAIRFFKEIYRISVETDWVEVE
ncbi:DEAD/DEAH box helicase [Flavobacterium cerinum]|uniref:DEAD/DEAH box helicase n=1 Tax=Flavobacterium cerinum TaxID=2502784 RepID=A0ABY5IT99_9FLAO|nr:DEAD/DEAH box helicase [Flavobacterium cerinum]UUC44691.1 DEAD/DEAH box helicase [Flavobacterium cerinum]